MAGKASFKKGTGKKDSKEGKPVEKKKDLIFPKGIVVFKPFETAPNSVKAEIIVSLSDFTEFCEENPSLLHENKTHGTQIKLTVRESEKGFYLTVNDYKKPE